MKILFLVPSSRYAKNVHRDVLYGCWCKGGRIGGGTLPPLTLLSVATVLKQNNFSVELIDMMEQKVNLPDVLKRIHEFKIVFILTSTMSINEDALLLQELKNKNKQLSTVIFGSHATFMPESCLEKEGVDFVIRYEPEFSAFELVKKIVDKNSTDFSDIKWLGFKTEGRIVINQDGQFIKDYNLFPIPDRSLLAKGAVYFNPIIKRYPFTTAVTSRGCIGRCKFCTVPQLMGPSLRCWKADKVLEEIEYLLSLGYKEIYYRDETFTTFKRRNRSIFENIVKKKMKFSWICNVRIGTVDKEDLYLMKKAGCRVIKVGVESGAQKILDASCKNILVSDIEKVFLWCRKLNIATHAHFMFGMPGETKKSIAQTIDFIRKIKPVTIDIGICSPYPGTDLFNILRARCPEIGDGSSIDLSNLHTKAKYTQFYTDISPEYIEESIGRTYRDFYLRFSYILKQALNVRSFSEFINLARSGLNVTKFALKKNG